ncbi:MAG TPA: isocitrate/isopropylmalate family dehydrogenase, partial [Deinococcales bacterium]|nr:isocitrate/isopropylmalate family dehydrogenase [Deinococcales bacterium]
GQDAANPVAAMLSAAMLLRHSWDSPEAADELEEAVRVALSENPTRDLGGTSGTRAFTDLVLAKIGTDRAVA